MTEVEPAMFSSQNPELWFAVASIIVIALAWNPIGKILAKTLDARADKIRADIAAAEKLLSDAKTALARYTGALAGAEEEARRIIEQAHLEAEQIRVRSAEELEHALKAREQHVLDRIQQAEAAAVAEIRDATVTLAIQASRAALRDNLNDNQQHALLEKAVGAVKSNLR
jgi:F-type H+-transporting ATPase subunit b